LRKPGAFHAPGFSLAGRTGFGRFPFDTLALSNSWPLLLPGAFHAPGFSLAGRMGRGRFPFDTLTLSNGKNCHTGKSYLTTIRLARKTPK
jgi:hypothetical protein